MGRHSEKEEKVKLNLASGKMYIDGWVNIDNLSMSDNKVDIEDDVLHMGWQENTADEILVCHFMMYIHRQEAPEQLARWFSWLKPGGTIRIETGDLKKIAYNISRSNEPEEIDSWENTTQLFGWDETRGHKWAWCPETLKPLMEKAGFVDVQWRSGGLHGNPHRDFTIKGTKK